ncbi:hypothetical protein LEP1GSC047_4279 [Leptospira inadai serovar Lyme str. 10]|uniref:Uncharacterized protein n=1 Tax=Leptospira inadai serovar Lyme str. 10 TaxID=1049790 RepID=V6HCC4_9LEPT|nr:hypothetical protein LEP1GSC047_4279 [Leptospira inadai serovar Lyme str. 10]
MFVLLLHDRNNKNDNTAPIRIYKFILLHQFQIQVPSKRERILSKSSFIQSSRGPYREINVFLIRIPIPERTIKEQERIG